MKKEKEVIESLVAGGLIGATLGALITENKNGAILGTLAGAAITATLQASEDAAKTNVPVVMEEKGKLYKILPGGEKKFIRSLNKPAKKSPKNFRLT